MHESGPEPSPLAGTPSMEIAHVLFMDIVSYSMLPMDEQERILRDLQEMVRSNREFAAAQMEDRLIRLPTGDGMALVFFKDAEAPVRCALELARSLADHHPTLKLRMGINSGPVYRVADINANRNVAGAGINIAQRVMDCGDAGHILLSKPVADVLGQVNNWRTMRPRLPPRAIRTATSRRRPVARVSIRLATLAHAISSTNPTAANRIIMAGRTLPTNSSVRTIKFTPLPVLVSGCAFSIRFAMVS